MSSKDLARLGIPSDPDKDALIRQLVEAAALVHRCGNGGAKLSRKASDATRAALTAAKEAGYDP